MHDPAQVRCMRLASGLRDDELALIAGIEQRAIYRWETGQGRHAIPASIIDLLTTVLDSQQKVTDELVVTARETGKIRCHHTNGAASTATGGRIPMASAFRVCAGRAWQQVPAARIVVADDAGNLTDDTLGTRAASIGLGVKPLARALGVSVATARRWISATATPPAHMWMELADLESIARDHQALLSASDDVIEVCQHQRDVNRRWPTLAPSTSLLGLELSVHQTAAGLAGYATGKPLVFVPGGSK